MNRKEDINNLRDIAYGLLDRHGSKPSDLEVPIRVAAVHCGVDFAELYELTMTFASECCDEEDEAL